MNNYIVSQRGKITMLKEEDILYFMAAGSYSYIKMFNGDLYKQSCNMMKAFDRVVMKERFHKTFRKYFVNSNYIKGFVMDDRSIYKRLLLLYNDELLPVSSHYFKEFKKIKVLNKKT